MRNVQRSRSNSNWLSWERKFISFKSNARVITEEMEFLLNENPIHRNRHRRRLKSRYFVASERVHGMHWWGSLVGNSIKLSVWKFSHFFFNLKIAAIWPQLSEGEGERESWWNVFENWFPHSIGWRSIDVSFVLGFSFYRLVINIKFLGC